MEATSLEVTLQQLLQKDLVKKALLDDAFLHPQLASLSEEVPTDEGWIFETKFDGYRIIARKEKGEVSLVSRNGLDWTHRFPNVALDLKSLMADSFVIDGEIVVVGEEGHASFSGLQKSLSENGGKKKFTYYVFDMTYLNGIDLRPLFLLGRKRLLQHLVPEHRSSSVKLSSFSTGDGLRRFVNACHSRSEGIVAKRVFAPYVPKRTPDWLKIKCSLQDEFVIGGYTDPAGSRKHFGSLLIGAFGADGSFLYTGKVGTGFDQSTLRMLKEKLSRLETRRNVFDSPLGYLERRNAHFVKPRLVAQIAYTERTADGRLRHPVFLGLREDKAAEEVVLPELQRVSR